MSDKLESQSKQGNNLTVYVGIVANDKISGSREIQVYLQELLPFLQKELDPKEQQVEVSLNNEKQGNTSSTPKQTNVIKAVYMGDECNKTYPPDVVKGEQVYVYNYTNTDTYYWRAMGRDHNLRVFEKVRWHVANSKDRSKTLDDTNTYFFEMNTLTTKEIRFQTSKSDGEAHVYVFRINPKEQVIQILDDINNEFYINSKERQLYIRNTDGCILHFDKRQALLVIPDSLTIKTGKQIVIDTPHMTTLTKNFKHETDGYSLTASKSSTTKSPNIGHHGHVEATTIVVRDIQSENSWNDIY